MASVSGKTLTRAIAVSLRNRWLKRSNLVNTESSGWIAFVDSSNVASKVQVVVVKCGSDVYDT